jgi:mTERF
MRTRATAYVLPTAYHGQLARGRTESQTPTVSYGRSYNAALKTSARCCAEVKKPRANPRDILTDDELGVWAAVVAEVRSVDPTALDGGEDAIVSKAFGWGPTSQRFWRGDVVQEIPSSARVGASLAFLRDELGITDPDIAAMLKKFPELLRLDVQDRMRANVEFMQTTWNITGSRLVEAVKSQPQVLGFDVDCGGDCQSECARCWARF